MSTNEVFMISSRDIIARIEKMFPGENAEWLCTSVIKNSPCTLIDIYEFLIVTNQTKIEMSLGSLSELIIALSCRGISGKEAGDKMRMVMKNLS